MPVLPPLSELNLSREWVQFCKFDYSYTVQEQHRNFRTWLRDRTSEPRLVNTRVLFCLDCNLPVFKSDMQERAGRHVCATCAAQYTACSDCSTLTRSHSLVRVRDDYYICINCRQTRYLGCPICGCYYLRNDPDAIEEHKHICCASPQLEFEVAGTPNDTRVELLVAAGTISEAGIRAIRRAINNYAESIWSDTDAGNKAYTAWYDVSRELAQHVGDKWQTKQGNFTKRLSSFAYKRSKLKAPPELLQTVGTIAHEHSKGATFSLEFTRLLNMSAAEFAHSGSCWWNGYVNSRCALKTNGGFGIRTFNENDGVTGRCWVMPLKKSPRHVGFVPTFDTQTPDAYLVFNGYHALEGYAPARILAQMTGTTYRKVGISTRFMSINSCSGYLIGAEEVVAPYTDSTINLEVEQHADLFQREQQQLERVAS